MKTKKDLDSLSSKDTYSLVMFVLFKLRSIPEYAILSQLVYLLDEKSFIKLLKYYAGETITIPTLEELEVIIKTLNLYHSVEIEGQDFDDALDNLDEEDQPKVKKVYNRVRKIMEKYSFV